MKKKTNNNPSSYVRISIYIGALLTLFFAHSGMPQTVEKSTPGTIAKPAIAAAPDCRPAFHKAEHLGTVWVAMNSWYTHTVGQTPHFTDRFLWTSNHDYFTDLVLTAKKLEEYGINGFKYEVTPWTPNDPTLEEVADAFQAAGNGRKVMLFSSAVPLPPATIAAIANEPDRNKKIDKLVEQWVGFLNSPEGQVLKNHPNYARIDGRPIIVSYGAGPLGSDPAVWGEAVKRIEAAAFPCRWFYCSADLNLNLENLKLWLPHIDGVTSYAPFGPRTWLAQKPVVEYMRRFYPGKVFEADAYPRHNSDLHFGKGQDAGVFTYLLRESLKVGLGLKPDALEITNWSDFQENSHVIPSYQQLDSFLRMIRSATAEWRGRPEKKSPEPELILSSRIGTLVGAPLEFEVVALPLAGQQPEIQLDLRLVDEMNKELHVFPPQTLTVNGIQAEVFRTASLPFAESLAVFPVLRYTCNGKSYGPYRFRGTRLWFGNTPTQLIWSTPVDWLLPELEVNFWINNAGMTKDSVARAGDYMVKDSVVGEKGWENYGIYNNSSGWVKPGGILLSEPGSPDVLLVGRGVAALESAADVRWNLLVNGMPLAPMNLFRGPKSPDSFSWKRPHTAPLEWAELEAFRFRPETFSFTRPHTKTPETVTFSQPEKLWTSLPITVVPTADWLTPVPVPVPVAPMEHPFYAKYKEEFSTARNHIPFERIETLPVPKYRIPFWHYRFDRGWGALAMDISGYDHHGWLGDRYCPQLQIPQLGPFCYRFANIFSNAQNPIENREFQHPWKRKNIPAWQRDADGVGCIVFNGTGDTAFFPPRTVFPYAETWEFVVKPEATGRSMVIASSNGGGRAQKMVVGLDASLRPFAEVATRKPEAEKGPFGGQPYDQGPGPNGQRSVATSPTPLAAGQWSCLTVVNDCKTVSIYINGKLCGASVPAPIWGEYLGFSELRLGGRFTGFDPWDWGLNGSDWYKGALREFRITGRPLQPDEIASNRPDALVPMQNLGLPGHPAEKAATP